MRFAVLLKLVVNRSNSGRSQPTFAPSNLTRVTRRGEGSKTISLRLHHGPIG